MDLITKITQQYSSMTRSEQKIADYILHNLEKMLTLSTRSLADEVGVSSTMIIRFVRTVGFDTYAAMRLAIARSAEMRLHPTEMASKSSFSPDYAQLYLHNTILCTVAETRRLQSMELLQKAAEAISRSNMLYLYGVGSSGIAATTFQNKLVYINHASTYYPDGSLSAASTSHSTKKDAALGISYSGCNRAVQFSMETCRQNGTPTIGITQKNSPLARHLDILLPIPYVNDGVCYGANLSLYAQLVVLDMLFLVIQGLSRDQIEESLQNSKRVVKQSIATSNDF